MRPQPVVAVLRSQFKFYAFSFLRGARHDGLRPLLFFDILRSFQSERNAVTDMNDYVPGLEGVPATKSNISFIDGEKGLLAYRGYTIEQLAEYSSFEETALLLLDGKLPTAAELTAFDFE